MEEISVESNNKEKEKEEKEEKKEKEEKEEIKEKEEVKEKEEIKEKEERKENEEKEERKEKEEKEEKDEIDKSEIDKSEIEKEMKEICNNILIKHLDDRPYEKDKLPKWSELILNDASRELKKKFPEYGYGIIFYISDKTNYVSSSKSVLYPKTDFNFLQVFNTKDFYSEIRVFANKKYTPRKDFMKNISPSEIIKINNILRNILECRSYKSDKCSNYMENIVNDINSVLIERNNRPCSFHVCFINKLPVKNIYFNYIFNDLDYMPFFFTYANDSLSCIVYLFIVDN